MNTTYALRRQEIVGALVAPRVRDVVDRWPALLMESQVFAEFHRINNVNLRNQFYKELDRHAPKLITLFRDKGTKTGKIAEELAKLMRIYELQSADGPDLTDTPVALLTVVTDDTTDTALFSPESICIVVEDEILVSGPTNLADSFLLLFGYTLRTARRVIREMIHLDMYHLLELLLLCRSGLQAEGEQASTDLLLQPNISVSSMNGVSEAQQQGFQVFRGSTFTISCSIQPQYPGGSFQLTFTSANSAHNSTQPAVNHSANFLFPAAEPSHQGTYSCVYHLYVFSHNFSSESRLLSLTISEPVRLVGGASRCAGTLELKQGEWRPVSYITVDYYSDWTLKKASAACRELDCGFAVSIGGRKQSSDRSVWMIGSDCVESGSALRECVASSSSSSILNLSCSGSVRLVNGSSLCSGRLEVKTNQSTQHWSSVCEHDFDQHDAEVVCRELGCGAPSVLQGALYGEVEPPTRTKEFQCGGHESALLDCRSSISDRNSCSPGKAVGLTCSEPVRLVGGSSRCAGTLEVKHQRQWRPVGGYYDWPLKQAREIAAAACRELDCGSAVSVKDRESSVRSVLWIRSNCVQSGSALRECAKSLYSAYILDLTCSDLLLQPNISVSSSMDGVSEAQQQGFQVFRGSTFNISCFIQPQYPGGSFQLTFTSSNSTHNCTQPAVNHSAHFLFPAAEPAHQGTYSCVYRLYVFSHNFSSESRPLSLTVSDLLLQPNISVSSSMNGVSEAQQQGFQVFRGSTFNISCSIQPQYPGGSFQLTFTSSNSTHNSTQPAVNHSAHFLFPAAEPSHQGTYSCVYHLYVFSHNFSSGSRLLSLTISGKLTVYRFGEDDWSKLSENYQLSTCF
ncbi:hypothetical protein EPR50_G00200690 [Perca flavescens]|uniref:SRCR domain-containing protein n=1 Tax=Perca flavescens TaxID=8167 RepID=A0A484C3B5_PERFV|nr:hypothetical protein EPR50_G00200690 [Perca flavescens]